MINKDLKYYIEKHIIPKYKNFDGGHNIDHVKEVIKESLILAKEYDVNENMCYTIAAYHDIALPKGRKLHHINSAIELRKDDNIRKWFNEKEIELMSNAIEDHRASSQSSPRTIYGAIIAEADRDLRPKEIFKRCILYCLSETGDTWNYLVNKSMVKEHLNEKYGLNGYMKLHLNSKKNLEGLIKLREIIASETLFNELFDTIWKEIKKVGNK